MTDLIPESATVIFQRMATDIVTAVPDLNPQLRNSIINAITVADANAFFEAYKTLERSLDMSFWDTATGIYLERWAAIFGITRNAASKATGFVTFTGVASTVIPSGTEFSSDSGGFYTTLVTESIQAQFLSFLSINLEVDTATVVTNTANHGLASNMEVTINGADQPEYNGTFVIVVTGLNSFTYTVLGNPSSPATGSPALLGTFTTVQSQSNEFGADQNLVSGTAVSLASPIAGVDNTGYVSFDELAGGSDEESDASLRERFLFRVQNPVSIFNRSWIEIEAKKVSGVTRVFVQTVDDLQGQIEVLNLTQVGGFATVETISPHGLGDGQPIGVSGAAEPEYNTIQKRSLFIDANKVGYLVDGDPSSPATGNITMSFSLSALGQVRVLFVRDNDPSIIPTPSEVQAVRDQLLLTLPVVPGTEDLIVLAPIPNTVDFTFGIFSPNSQSMKDAVTASLKSFFSTNIGVADDVLEIDYLNVIRNTLDAGGNPMGPFTLVTPSGNVPIGASEIGILGAITFP